MSNKRCAVGTGGKGPGSSRRPATAKPAPVDHEQAHRAFYAGLTADQVVHYRNCDEAYVRCHVVVGLDGEKKFVPVALIGQGWKIWKHTAPHHQRQIAEGTGFTPHASCVYENNPYGTDPRTLGPIDPAILK